MIESKPRTSKTANVKNDGNNTFLQKDRNPSSLRTMQMWIGHCFRHYFGLYSDLRANSNGTGEAAEEEHL